MTASSLESLAVACGATKAIVIPQSQIELNEEYRKMCEQNTCGAFGQCWACPPDCGTIEENMAEVRAFPRGLLYQTIGELEDSFDIEGMQECKRRHVETSVKIRDALNGLSLGRRLHLAVGGCGLCERCAKRDNLPCRFPDKAFPSMEGYGIGVYNTTKGTPLKYINGQNTVTYFGLVLFEGELDA